VGAGDHIYKQDYRDLLRFHQEKGADLTVAVMNVHPDEVHRFGITIVGKRACIPAGATIGRNFGLIRTSRPMISNE
jgi:ADP-glucose pyrophosphorylase